jgi:aldehyde dehydrogenase (NAD+)
MNVIINDKHYERLKRLLGCGRAVIGGGFDDERRFIEPTLLEDVNISDPIMQEEIFGPVLPMLVYKDLETCIEYIRDNEKPLSLYMFTRSRQTKKRIFETCSFGGGCINDTIVHIATPYMPFGGTGGSGMGSYHGKASFDAFTHYRSIMKNSSRIDIPIRYRPYTENKEKLIRFLMK